MTQIWKNNFRLSVLIGFNLELYFEYFQTLNSKKLSVFTAKFSFLISKRASLLWFEVSLSIKLNLDKFMYV